IGTRELPKCGSCKPSFKATSFVQLVMMVSGCVLLLGLHLLTTCMAAYEDARCQCICVDRLGSYNGTKPTRKIYVAAVPADKCVCTIMLGKDADLCPYCDCKYQVRSTTTIKVVVCLILVIISALTLYMLFLLLLEPLLSARRAGRKLMTSQADSSSCLGSSSESAPAGAAPARTVYGRQSFMANAEMPWIRTVTTAGSGGHLPASKGLGIAVSWNRVETGTGELLNMEQSTLDASPDQTRLRQRSAKPDLLILPAAGSSRPPLSAPGAAAAAGVSTVVKTVRDQQQRWKGNVEVQRARVFSDHTLLN
ncbi:hypothetical protein CRM22_011313, partial [Opisthorchis felineus]